MVLLIVPECTKCKTSKNVVFNHTWTDSKIGFFISYCEKCYSVMECMFSSRVLTEKESKQELKRIKEVRKR